MIIIKRVFLALTVSLATATSMAGCIGPVIQGKCHGTEVKGYGDSNDTSYTSNSGTKYQYDLTSPQDQNRYSIDSSAQIRDSLNVNPRSQLDRSMGQYGGGILGD